MNKRSVAVLPADPAWQPRFAEEALALRDVFGYLMAHIHHMGSTAVPGLAAKPIIDILIEVQDIADVDRLNPAMASLGYVPQGEKGIPGRRFFQKGGHQRTHHVHVYQVGDAQIARHLAFRDYLRAHPALCSEYSQLKMHLAQVHHGSPADYQAGKDEFIKEHEARALTWAARQDQPR